MSARVWRLKTGNERLVRKSTPPACLTAFWQFRARQIHHLWISLGSFVDETASALIVCSDGSRENLCFSLLPIPVWRLLWRHLFIYVSLRCLASCKMLKILNLDQAGTRREDFNIMRKHKRISSHEWQILKKYKVDSAIDLFDIDSEQEMCCWNNLPLTAINHMKP